MVNWLPVPDIDVDYLSDQGCLVVIVVAKSNNHGFPETIYDLATSVFFKGILCKTSNPA